MRAPIPRRCRAIATLMFTAGVGACEPSDPGRIATAVELSAFPAELAVGGIATVTATCVDAHGPIPGHRLHWTNLRPQLVTMRVSGTTAIVEAIHAGAGAEIVADCQYAPLPRLLDDEGYWQVGGGPLYADAVYSVRSFDVVPASAAQWSVDSLAEPVILRKPERPDLVTGVSRIVSARGLSPDGAVIPPSAFKYAVDDTLVAVVSASGLLTGRALGTTTLRVSLGAESRAIAVQVEANPVIASWDVALIDAHWTQGPQDATQSIPILRESRAAVVNVLVAATVDTLPMDVELEVFDASGATIFTDTAAVTLRADSAPTYAAPNAQFLVPRPIVATVATWRLRLIGADAESDASSANNRLPRSGVATLRVQTPPVLKLHLVPIRLVENDNATTTILPAQRVYYDSIARLRMPFGRVETTIGEPLVSRANFFFGGQNGGPAFFATVLQDVDAARTKDASLADRYWIGVIPNPVEPSGGSILGMAFFPELPSSIGPMSRSSVVLGHDWFPSAPLTTGTIVAHELGHNFSRQHAPCGNPGGPDPFYPVTGGGIGEWVTWTTAFETGVNPTGQIFPAANGDVMGYCGSNLLGPYTYKGILSFRSASIAASLVAPREREAILTVRGWLNANELTITRTEYTEGERIAEPAASPVEVIVMTANGTVLARSRALLGTVGDHRVGRPFTAHIALSEEERGRATTLVVRAGGVERRVDLPRTTP